MNREPIRQETVQKMAALAHLDLTEEEVTRYAEQFERLLEYVEQLSDVDVTGVEPLSHVLDQVNSLREDLAAPSLSVADVLANAPRHQDGFVVVPKVVKKSR